jgi:hypothetical protein
LPAGSNSFRLLTGLSIGFSAGVQWDGSYIAATDQGYLGGHTSAINRVSVSGSAVTVVRTTVFTDKCFKKTHDMDMSQPFIGGTTRSKNAVIAGNLDCLNRLNVYNYTNGGKPKRIFPPSISPGTAIGQSLSPPAGGK